MWYSMKIRIGAAVDSTSSTLEEILSALVACSG